MTTTVSVSRKGEMELPEEFRKRKKIKPGTTLRVTDTGDGLYITPLSEPTEKELREVIAAAGSLTRKETREDEAMVQTTIADYRDETTQPAMNVVVDTNVVISAIFWPGESRHCMTLWARRKFQLAVTIPIFEEYDSVARRIARKFPAVNPDPWLKWIENKAKVYEPAPVGKQRSRDRDDDPFLACAFASSARIIISRDADLLVLEKPFGIEIVTPRQFLARFR